MVRATALVMPHFIFTKCPRDRAPKSTLYCAHKMCDSICTIGSVSVAMKLFQVKLVGQTEKNARCGPTELSCLVERKGQNGCDVFHL